MSKQFRKSICHRSTFRPRRMRFDVLERRDLFSGITLSDGVLQVFGTAGHDDARIWLSGDTVQVGLSTGTTAGKPWLDAGQHYRWDVQESYDRKAVKEVRFVGKGGDDWLETDAPVPIKAWGDQGSDTLEVYGKSSSELFGGTGNDTLVGGAGVDYLHGGNGDDILNGGGGNDVLWGDAGDDGIGGGDENDRLYGGAADSMFGRAGNDTLVSIDGDATDNLFGNGGIDSFWIDEKDWFFGVAKDQVQDAWLGEMGNVHSVRQFENGADKTLDGDDLIDPTDASYLKDFSRLPLFASAGPTPDDIRQGDVGDCWLLAALGAVAQSNPRAIRETVVDLGDSRTPWDWAISTIAWMPTCRPRVCPVGPCHAPNSGRRRACGCRLSRRHMRSSGAGKTLTDRLLGAPKRPLGLWEQLTSLPGDFFSLQRH